METSKAFNSKHEPKLDPKLDSEIDANKPGDRAELELDRLYSVWKDDRSGSSLTDRPTALREWTARYPAYGADLAEWTGAAPVVECADELNGPEIDRAEARVREIGRDLVAARRARYTATAPAAMVNTVDIVDIYTAARARSLNPRSLAVNLGVGLAIVAKLQQRLIRFNTIPAAFIDRLAQELNTTVQQLGDYLRQPATLASGASYKSNGVPQAAAQEDFAQAIRSCTEMNATQQQNWLSEPINGDAQ